MVHSRIGAAEFATSEKRRLPYRGRTQHLSARAKWRIRTDWRTGWSRRTGYESFQLGHAAQAKPVNGLGRAESHSRSRAGSGSVGPGRADLPLDLAAAFETAFDLCTQSASIDYQNEQVPDPPLSIDDADFVKHLLKKR
jgi:hypothetical protein